MRMHTKRSDLDGKRLAIIVDMDGTLVDVSSIRHYVRGVAEEEGEVRKRLKDFDAFHRESVNCPAIWKTVDQVQDFWEREYDILIVTARSQKYYNQTAWWLAEHAIPHTDLFMRPNGDFRKDYLVKKDILDRIRRRWHVVHAIDDNPNVIRLWEEEGISVTHVPGWEEGL